MKMFLGRAFVLSVNGLMLIGLITAFGLSGRSPDRGGVAIVWAAIPPLLTILALMSAPGSRGMLLAATIVNGLWSLLLLRLVMASSIAVFIPGLLVLVYTLWFALSLLSSISCWYSWKDHGHPA